MKFIIAALILFDGGIYFAYWWHINGKGSSEHGGKR